MDFSYWSCRLRNTNGEPTLQKVWIDHIHTFIYMELIDYLFAVFDHQVSCNILMFQFCFYFLYKLICRGIKSRSKKRAMGNFIHNQASPSHIGIRTAGVDNVCNFSRTNSDLCISIVTWNMNGQVQSLHSFVSYLSVCLIPSPIHRNSIKLLRVAFKFLPLRPQKQTQVYKIGL